MGNRSISLTGQWFLRYPEYPHRCSGQKGDRVFCLGGQPGIPGNGNLCAFNGCCGLGKIEPTSYRPLITAYVSSAGYPKRSADKKNKLI